MSYLSRSRLRRGDSGAIWPGFVDVLSTLLLVLIFLLVVYMLVQYFLQRSVSEKDEALNELDHQVAELADLLALERQSNNDLRSNISQLSAELQNSLSERDSLSLSLARSEEETDTLRLRLRDMTSEAQIALANATEADQKTAAAKLRAEAGEEKIRIMLGEVEQLRRDITALQTVRDDLEEQVVKYAAAMEKQEKEAKQFAKVLEGSQRELAELELAFTEARDRSSELMTKLSDENERTALAQKKLKDRAIRLRELQDLYLNTENQLIATRELSSQQRNEIVVLNNQILALRTQLTRIEEVLQSSEAETETQKVVIADLGRRLNLALAAKVEELAEYRSEFFGRLRQVLAGRQGFTIIGDRFVFQSEVLFASGSADLGLQGKAGLDTFATELKEVMARIPKDLPWILQVDGHTDRIPIKTSRFPSNWELSAGRAIEVVNYLVSRGIPPHRLSASGYGQFQPIDERDDEIGHRRNRRIELKLTQR